MINAIHAFSRGVCTPSSRQWVDAMFAEAQAVEGAGPRTAWLLGAAGLLVSIGTARVASLLSPLGLACLLAGVLGLALAIVEFEGLLIEDDLYLPFAGLALACFLAATTHHLRQGSTTTGPRRA